MGLQVSCEKQLGAVCDSCREDWNGLFENASYEVTEALLAEYMLI
jgi:hypothetical protein